MASAELQAHRALCLDGWNPRIFAEVISTVALAEERAPRTGPHKITFAALQEVNQRFADYPDAMRSCFAHIDLARTNRGLGTIGAPRILRVTKDGIVVEG